MSKIDSLPITTKTSLFSNILVAVDGSKSSLDALDSAIILAKSHGAKLTVLYVILLLSDSAYAIPSTSDYEVIPTVDESSTLLGKREKSESQQILNIIQSKAKENNIKIIPQLAASSNVAAGIIGYAEQEKIDLIIVGTRGRTGFRRLLLGSVASGVVTYAHCPVLVVK